MFTHNYHTLFGIIFYLVTMVIIGLYFLRQKNVSLEEYYLAKRSFGSWTAGISTGAADMSGWLFLGFPGIAYFTGFGEAFWTALGLFTGTCINWIFVSKRLRSYSVIANNAITIPEFLSRRFHDRNNYLLVISSAVSLVFFSLYMGAQFLTFGKFFNLVFDFGMTIMVITCALIVMLYTLLGGLRAVGKTNLVQGILMVFSLLIVLVFAFINAGGFNAVISNLNNFPRFMDFFGIAVPQIAGALQRSEGGLPLFEAGISLGILSIISALAWGLGYFGMPQILTRFMAVKNVLVIKKARIIAISWCFLVLFAALFIGLTGRAIYPTALNSANSAENIYIILSIRLFPPLAAGVLLSAILAACMSSADSYMLTVSSSLANDFYKSLIKKSASDREVIWVGRITKIAATIFGIIAAVSGNQSIFDMVSYAWAGLGASFGPVILFSLFWKRVTLPAAVAGMVTGGVMVVFWKNAIAQIGGIFSVYELLPAFAASCIVIVLISLITKKPSEEMEREFLKAKTA